MDSLIKKYPDIDIPNRTYDYDRFSLLESGISLWNNINDTNYYIPFYKYVPQTIKNISSKYNYYLWLPLSYTCSRLYYKRGKPCYNRVSYIIHLDSLAPNITRVEVVNIGNEIIVGYKLGITTSYLGFLPKMQHIQPETVLEYRVLLEIGKRTREKNMPDLILPNSSKRYYFKIRKDRIIHTDTIIKKLDEASTY
ncbi:MAG: hypothetical protein KAG64_01870 [Bacteroidales bacterium]|nr:hypothetical protein [Bacteroidales bacterium]